jgi:hypothetical protein
VNPALKRALWCRWFHRWRRSRPSSVTSRDPSAGASLTLTAGFGRDFCRACENTDYGRAYRRWLAS